MRGHLTGQKVAARWRAVRAAYAHGGAQYTDYTAVNPTFDALPSAAKTELRVRLPGDALTFDIDRRYHLVMAQPAELLQGTLDLLVLRTIELQPLHGVAIADRIEQVTRGVFVVGPGSLFPALHRLAEKGWIEGEWSELENGRRVKVYALTRSGRAQLAKEKRNWTRVFTAMNRALSEEA